MIRNGITLIRASLGRQCLLELFKSGKEAGWRLMCLKNSNIKVDLQKLGEILLGR